jgi:hypothetical protein
MPGQADGAPAPVQVQTKAASAAPTPQPVQALGGKGDEVAARAVSLSEPEAPPKDTPTVVLPEPHHRRSAGRSIVRALGLLLLIGAVGAAAFYGGMFYQKKQAVAEIPSAETDAGAQTAPTPADPEIEFEKQRREVDRAPAKMASQMASENGGKPLESVDPQFLYLYGRALMLTGKPVEASAAFKSAIEKIRERPARDPLKVETKLSSAVAALKSGNWGAAQAAAKELDEVIELENRAGAAPLPGGGGGAGGASTASKSPVSP